MLLVSSVVSGTLRVAMGDPVRVAMAPSEMDVLRDAIVAGGGVVSEAAGADAIVWVDPRSPDALRELLASSPARWVQLPFAGIESFVDAGVIDPGRTWTCAKGVYGEATAEQAVALLLAAARRLHAHARTPRWLGGEEAGAHRRLRGTTVLVVGTGGIGRAVARMLAPFGARIVAVSRTGAPVHGVDSSHRVDELAALVPDADWIVVAAAHTAETHHLFGKDVIGRMKGDAWIVNVARGGLIDTDALVDALRDDRIGGAALDVTDPEPLQDDHPLWRMPNAIVTSHTANTWAMAMPELAALVRRNVERFGRGEPLEGLVDPVLGY